MCVIGDVKVCDKIIKVHHSWSQRAIDMSQESERCVMRELEVCHEGVRCISRAGQRCVRRELEVCHERVRRVARES